MSTNRANLDQDSSAPIYAILTVLMIALSLVGVYLYFVAYKSPSAALVVDSPTPTPAVVEVLPSSEPTAILPTTVLKAVTPSPAATPTPTFKTLSSQTDGFSVDYSSSRSPYQDLETSGRRYTLYSSRGNISIHVGTTWSWSHPGRQFTDAKLVSGQPTFIYEIPTQTIVDFQFKGLNYTIQCIHQGDQTLQEECSQLLSNFRLSTGS